MTLHVAVFLKYSRIEQTVCFVCRTDSLFRRFALHKIGESYVTLPTLFVSAPSCIFAVLVLPNLVAFF
jgi:hypothetical protein